MSSAIQAAQPSALAPSGERWSWLSMMERATTAQLELALLGGVAPKMESLVGWEFGGGNCVRIYSLLGIRKFVKGFYEGPARDQGPSPSLSREGKLELVAGFPLGKILQGYNIAAIRNADAEPHVCKPSDEKPGRYGFYRVHAPVSGARDARYMNSLLLDYGLGGNGLFGPPLRDYIVQVYPDDPDLLLGKAYGAIGPIRIPLNFFVLKRRRAVEFGG